MAIGTPVCLGAKSHDDSANTIIDTNAAVPSGALVVVLFSIIDTADSITYNGLAQDGGLTWTLDVDETEGKTTDVSGGNPHYHLALSAPAPSGLASSTEIEFNAFTTGSSWGVTWSVHYVEGVDLGASRLDNYKWATVTTSGTTWSTGTASITANDAILLSQSISDGSLNGTNTVTSPATEITGSDQVDTGNDWSSVCGYLITSSSGTYGISGTVSDSHEFGCSAFFAAYKAGATSQTLLPDADTSAGSWGTAPLYSKINDSSDATVITDTLA